MQKEQNSFGKMYCIKIINKLLLLLLLLALALLLLLALLALALPVE